MVQTVSEPGTRREQLVAMMRQALRAYSEERLPLPELVSDVESVIDALAEVADARWIEELRAQWWQLEFAHATSLDQQRPLTKEEREAVDRAVETLAVMIVPY